MPIYEYACPTCKHEFEVLVRNDEGDPLESKVQGHLYDSRSRVVAKAEATPDDDGQCTVTFNGSGNSYVTGWYTGTATFGGSRYGAFRTDSGWMTRRSERCPAVGSSRHAVAAISDLRTPMSTWTICRIKRFSYTMSRSM